MRLLTVDEAASRLGLKPASLRMWIWTRSIEFVRVGRRAIRLREDVIENLIAQGTVPARNARQGKGRR